MTVSKTLVLVGLSNAMAGVCLGLLGKVAGLGRLRKGLLPLAVLGLGALGACTRAEEGPDLEVKALREKIHKLETELSDFKDRIKTSDADRGLRDQLIEDEALLKSRLERLRERSKNVAPEEAGNPH